MALESAEAQLVELLTSVRNAKSREQSLDSVNRKLYAEVQALKER